MRQSAVRRRAVQLPRALRPLSLRTRSLVIGASFSILSLSLSLTLTFDSFFFFFFFLVRICSTRNALRSDPESKRLIRGAKDLIAMIENVPIAMIEVNDAKCLSSFGNSSSFIFLTRYTITHTHTHTHTHNTTQHNTRSVWTRRTCTSSAAAASSSRSARASRSACSTVRLASSVCVLFETKRWPFVCFLMTVRDVVQARRFARRMP
jgi:hypothetical protein